MVSACPFEPIPPTGKGGARSGAGGQFSEAAKDRGLALLQQMHRDQGAKPWVVGGFRGSVPQGRPNIVDIALQQGWTGVPPSSAWAGILRQWQRDQRTGGGAGRGKGGGEGSPGWKERGLRDDGSGGESYAKEMRWISAHWAQITGEQPRRRTSKGTRSKGKNNWKSARWKGAHKGERKRTKEKSAAERLRTAQKMVAGMSSDDPMLEWWLAELDEAAAAARPRTRSKQEAGWKSSKGLEPGEEAGSSSEGESRIRTLQGWLVEQTKQRERTEEKLISDWLNEPAQFGWARAEQMERVRTKEWEEAGNAGWVDSWGMRIATAITTGGHAVQYLPAHYEDPDSARPDNWANVTYHVGATGVSLAAGEIGGQLVSAVWRAGTAGARAGWAAAMRTAGYSAARGSASAARGAASAATSGGSRAAGMAGFEGVAPGARVANEAARAERVANWNTAERWTNYENWLNRETARTSGARRAGGASPYDEMEGAWAPGRNSTPGRPGYSGTPGGSRGASGATGQGGRGGAGGAGSRGAGQSAAGTVSGASRTGTTSGTVVDERYGGILPGTTSGTPASGASAARTWASETAKPAGQASGGSVGHPRGGGSRSGPNARTGFARPWTYGSSYRGDASPGGAGYANWQNAQVQEANRQGGEAAAHLDEIWSWSDAHRGGGGGGSRQMQRSASSWDSKAATPARIQKDSSSRPYLAAQADARNVAVDIASRLGFGASAMAAGTPSAGKAAGQVAFRVDNAWGGRGSVLDGRTMAGLAQSINNKMRDGMSRPEALDAAIKQLAAFRASPAVTVAYQRDKNEGRSWKGRNGATGKKAEARTRAVAQKAEKAIYGGRAPSKGAWG